MQKWTRVRAGLYTCGRFEVERVEPEDREAPRTDGPVWICRLDGVAFDGASSLQEAKTYCREDVR